jgi:hypothetical protein
MASINLLTTQAAKAAGFTIDFDSLPSQGATYQSLDFATANGGSSTYQGVTFGSEFRVIGDDYRVGGPAPNPAFGLPHSGHYFLANGNTPNDNLILTTSLVLTEAWFGRNEYYGYGGGSSSVTVTALGSGGVALGSAAIALPDTFPYTGNIPGFSIGNGLPDPLVRLDTSSFLSLAGITGYRISRVETGPFGGDWIGDDFMFESPPLVNVPEPRSCLGLVGLGLLGLVSSLRPRMKNRD